EQLRGLGTGERVRLDLVCAPQPAWLGQPLSVTLVARDAAGVPLADRRVTVEAGLGEVVAVYGFAVQRARAVTVRTGADGSARFALHFRPIEPLTADQQAALEEALGTLDPAAPSPHLLRDAFLALAARYQEERSRSLRGAMDIYSRQWKAHFFDRLNPSNLGFSWPLETSVVRADCHEGDGAGSAAQAVAAAHWRNWTGAWFEFLGEHLRQGVSLREAFAGAKKRGAQGYRLVGDLTGEAYSFVSAQRGLAAQWVSQRVVSASVQDFLANELDGVDDPTQQILFSHLEAAAEQITPRNRGTLAAVDQARSDLHAEIQKVSRVNGDIVGEIAGIRDEIRAQASGVQAEVAAFAAERATLEQRLNAFDSGYADVLQEIEVFQARYADLGSRYEEFAAKYGSFAADYAAYTQDRAGLLKEISSMRTEVTNLQVQRSQLNQDVAAMKAEMGGVKSDLQDLSTRVGTRPG
ncbi:MAG: hypothetical protein IH608_09265, partial [Proteobacteria bacterium]|nr:hypothetical protein [Pseudomonadota bacterium]